MCRLLAYSAKTPRAVEDLFDPGEFDRFRKLSHLHRDGWGMSWVTSADEAAQPDCEEPGMGEASLRARRSILPAHEDPTFAALAGRRLGRAGFLHLLKCLPQEGSFIGGIRRAVADTAAAWGLASLNEGWADIPAASVLHVDLRTGSSSFHSFDGSAVSFPGSADAFDRPAAPLGTALEGQ